MRTELNCLIGTVQKRSMAQRNVKTQTTYKWYEKAITYSDADLQHPAQTNSVTMQMEATSSF